MSSAHIEPVVCPGIIFSDSAIREQGTGKLSIIGSFAHFNAPGFPFLSSQFIVTILLSNIRGPIEGLPITVRIEATGSAHVLSSVSGQINLGPEITGNEVLEVVFPIPPVPFQQAGTYDVNVLVGSEFINRRQLFVRSTTATPQA
jgi:Family of unknown function (DUF6941)